MNGKLYLIPTILSEDALHVIPAYVHEITKTIKIFFAENKKDSQTVALNKCLAIKDGHAEANYYKG